MLDHLRLHRQVAIAGQACVAVEEMPAPQVRREGLARTSWEGSREQELLPFGLTPLLRYLLV
jgi:hypothetical protein